MKLHCLPIVFAFAVALPAHAAWIDADGKPRPETESMRSVGKFAVQIVLTPDEKALRKAWESQSGRPQLKTIAEVRRGQAVSAVLIFHGCSPNPLGVCDVVAQFTLESPGGKRTPGGKGPVWLGAPMADRVLQLGQSSMSLRFDNTDRPGDYRIVADVKDRVSGASIWVAGALKLVP